MELRLEQHNAVRSEQVLVARAQTGDTAAFELLYRQNGGRVYAVCLRMVKDEERAEELTQEIFIRAWEMLGRFRGDSLFSTWLHRVAVNMTLERIRSQKRYTSHVESTDDLTAFDNIREKQTSLLQYRRRAERAKDRVRKFLLLNIEVQVEERETFPQSWLSRFVLSVPTCAQPALLALMHRRLVCRLKYFERMHEQARMD
ncbi:MAG: sigma-70 family RNA polymerase sigma factor [Ignavibacteriae bacterium]|nr:sigma-70 family RNA polymerase sigma factor [Ignavibacteriota bacterium]